LIEPFAGSLGFFQGHGPRTLQLQDLSTMDETLTAVMDQALLGFTPAAQGSRPLVGASEIEAVLTRLDDRAVDDPDAKWREIASRRGSHNLVEQRQPLGSFSRANKCLAASEATGGNEIRIAEALANEDDLFERRTGATGIASPHELQADRHEEVALLDAVAPAIVDEPPTAREPAAAASLLPLEQEQKAKPVRAASSSLPATPSQKCSMRSGPDVLALGISADEVSGHREPFEVIRIE
jgi:hypothetical protein